MQKINFRSKFSIIGISVVCLSLIGGGWLFRTATAGNTEPAKVAKPITPDMPQINDCYESRTGYSSVTRVENVVPQYGYPNVKCSKRTGKVLWWGDPYDGTIPMGDMPDIKDASKGDFANAVVKPREPQLTYYNMDPEKHCALCHDGKQVPVPTSKKPRALTMHQDIVEDALQLQHGRGAIWCLDCHSATNRNKLIDHQGAEISFNQPQKLCGKCHGDAYRDWRMGIHGKRIGSWATGEKKRWWVCTECHNPHTVQLHKFDPIQPEPAPALPRGMKNADHDRIEHSAR